MLRVRESPERGRRLRSPYGYPTGNENGGAARIAALGKEAIATSILSPAKVSALALAFYLSEVEKGKALPLSPADATTAIAKRAGSPPKSRIIGIVAEVYYRENGVRFPLDFGKRGAKPAAIRAAVAKRRKAGGRLGRWDVIAYSLAAALGSPGEKVSLATVRALATAGGVDTEASYTGRGTRAGAPKTRASETAEIDERVS